MPFQSSLGDPADSRLAAIFSGRLMQRLRGLRPFAVWPAERTAPDPPAPAAITALGQAAHAQYILYGRMEAASSGTSLTVMLFEAKRGAAIWAHTYTGPLTDLLHVEGEIAQAVAAQARHATPQPDLHVVAPAPSASPDAYLRSLRAKAYLESPDQGSARRAMSEMLPATAEDSASVLTWSSLTESAVARLGRDGEASPSADSAILAVASYAARNALRLDAQSADAWMAEGAVRSLEHPRDYRDALRAYDRAVELEPWRAETRRRYASALLESGAVQEGIAQLHTALQIEPGNPATLVEFATAASHARRYRDACHALNAAVASDARNADAYVQRAFVRLHLNDVRNAWADAETGVRLGAWLTGETAAAIADARSHDTATARQRATGLAVRLRPSLDRPTVWESHYLAASYCAVDQDDRAVQLLAHAQPRGAALWWALGDPAFDRLRNVPAFVQLVNDTRPLPAAYP